jgi:hypothetical protein
MGEFNMTKNDWQTRGRLDLIVVIAALTLVSCAPSPIYRLHPVDEDTTWLFGQQYAKVTEPEFEMAVAFDRSYRDYLIFDVEVTNLSEESFLVSPEQFYYRPTSQADARASNRFRHAVDPEKKLLDIDKKASKKEADQRTEMFFVATGTIVEVIDTVSGGRDAEDDAAYTQMHVQHEISQQEFERRMTDLNSLREHWQTETMRKTDLGPDYSVAGKVYFPISKNASHIELHLPLATKEVLVVFEQTKHKP